MSKEQIKAFLAKVKTDANLQEKLKAAEDTNAVTAIAKEAGFSISADDLKNAQPEISEEELAMREISDGELERAAGGGCDRGSDGVNSCAYLRLTTIWIYGKDTAL